MSTKIYDGFRLKNMTLNKLQDWSMEFREKIKVVNQELIAKHQAFICSRLIDFAFIFDSKNFLDIWKEHNLTLSHYPFAVALEIMNQRRKKIDQTDRRDPEFDFSCEIVFIPVKSQVLGIPYTEQEEHIKIIESMPGYEEYGYWNNTDRPDNLSEARWDKRRDDWDLALPGLGISNLSGFKITCKDKSWVDIKVIASYIPDIKTRAKTFAEKLVSNKFNKDSMCGYLAWSRSDEYRQMVAETEKELLEILRPITPDDLLMPFKEIYKFIND